VPLLYGKIFKGGWGLVSMERRKPEPTVEDYVMATLVSGLCAVLLITPYFSSVVRNGYETTNQNIAYEVKSLVKNIPQALANNYRTYSKITIPMN